jgi:hypothetical protein
VHDGIERLASGESGVLTQRAVEPFGDILHADLVRQRLVAADGNVVRVVTRSRRVHRASEGTIRRGRSSGG